MDKREVYILSGLHKATNVISKKTNYKGQKVNKPQPVFLYNRYMSGVDSTDQFLQYYSFLHKSFKWSKKFFVHCLNMVILNAHILHKKYSDSKIMHWQFRIELVKHMLSNAQQQPWGIVPVPDPVDCPPTWLINTLLSPYQAKKWVGESTQTVLVSYVMSAKRHCQMLGLGTVANPKSTPLTGAQYVSVHCVLSLFKKIFNMFKKMFNMSKEATQSKWDNLCSNSLTAWAYSSYTQVPNGSIQISHV